MSEHELSASVELARGRLTALRARLEIEGTAPRSRDIVSALVDLQELLDKLQTGYGLLREVLDRTNDMVFAKHRDGRYAVINPRGADMLGKSVSEIVGADDRALFEPADSEPLMTIDREVMSTGVSRTHDQTFELAGVRTTLLTTTTAWYDANRDVCGVIGIAQDVTESRRNEREVASRHARLSSMAAEVVFSEERLRRTLAAELHNGLGQDIALAKLKLSMLRNAAGDDMHDPLNGIEQLVEQADRSLRSITFQISPPSLHDLGLVAALQWLAEDIGRKRKIEVRIEDDDSPAVADERVRVILFRAVRELLINAATHAQVNEVVVRLARRGSEIHVTVHDTGVGFDDADLEQRGYGLLGIREQLKYVDGSLHVDSSPGHGTTMTLIAPVSVRAARRTE